MTPVRRGRGPLVGGVTAIQGASQDYPKKAEALVRNVDLLIFGEQIAPQHDRLRPAQPDRVESIRRAIVDTARSRRTTCTSPRARRRTPPR